MAIPNIKLGRVESDPMRIPTSIVTKQSHGERFDQLLRDTVTRDEASELEARPRDVEAAVDELAPPTDSSVAPVEAEASRTEDLRADPAEQAVDASATGPAPAADVTESTRRGEPERQFSAGKGADSPRSSTQAPALATPIAAGAAPMLPDATPGVVLPGQTNQAVVRATEPIVRGGAAEALAADNRPAARAAAAGYATRTAAQAQLLEQARDSVFKQILMKLAPEGGEVRMRLEPPDLGELDLRLTVDAGNRLTLAIAAERNDVAHLLQRHLDELKQALQQNGLEVAGAEVQTRSEFERQGRGESSSQHGGANPGDETEQPAAAWRRAGYVTADGLDFWA